MQESARYGFVMRELLLRRVFAALVLLNVVMNKLLALVL